MSYETYIKEHSELDTPLIRLVAPGKPLWTKGIEVKELRTDEYESVTSNLGTAAIYDVRSSESLQGIINLGRTVFICILLSIGSIYFSRDADILVLGPIERMIEKVKLIANNPMIAASEDVENMGLFSALDKQAVAVKKGKTMSGFKLQLIDDKKQ